MSINHSEEARAILLAVDSCLSKEGAVNVIEQAIISADRRGWERAREQAAKIAEDNYIGQELGDYKKYKIPLADAIRKMEDV